MKFIREDIKMKNTKSIIDAYGSLDITFTEPLVDVREVREQVREEMLKIDWERQLDQSG